MKSGGSALYNTLGDDNMKKICIAISDIQHEHIRKKKARFGMTYTSQIQSLLMQDIERYQYPVIPPSQNIQIYNQPIVSSRVRRNDDIQVKSIVEEIKEKISKGEIEVKV